MEQIGAKFDAPNLRQVWPDEKEAIAKILEIIGYDISFNYTYDKFIAAGGAGLVFRVRDERLGIWRALKAPRPKGGRIEPIVQIMSSEIDKLLTLGHENIVPVYFVGKELDNLAGGTLNLPYYVMDYVQDASDFDKVVPNLELPELIRLFRQAIEAVAYLHREGIVHCDLKPANILIGRRGGRHHAWVSDLGYAKYYQRSHPEGDTEVRFTEKYAHPDLLSRRTRDSDELANVASVSWNLFNPSFDLYSMGITLFELCDLAQVARKGTSYVRRYLSLIAARLLDAQIPPQASLPANVRPDQPFDGLSRQSMREVSFQTSIEACEDLMKLQDEYPLHRRVRELNLFPAETVQLATQGGVVFTDRLKRIVEVPIMSRLGQTSQLGLLNFLYPGATHTRLEHSLGTFGMACRYVNALYHSNSDPLFRSIMTDRDIRRVLLASLLHDLGYFALAHDLEDCDELAFSHAELTKTFLREDTIRSVISGPEPDGWDLDVEEIISVLEADRGSPTGFKEQILRSIIDGPIDADKIDYLLRDSHHLEVPYGLGIDMAWFVRHLTVAYDTTRNPSIAGIGVTEKARVGAEAISFARYAMFSTVYWHHTSRALKAMLRFAVRRILASPRNADRAKFRDELAEFISSSSSFEVKESRSAVNENDRQMLAWLSVRGDAIVQEMVRLILGRKIYQRIATIDSQREPELFAGLTRLFIADGETDKENYRERLSKSIVSELERRIRLPGYEVPPDAVAKAAQESALILVDVPFRRGQKGEQLYFVREGEYGPPSLEASRLWSQLHGGFNELAGKVRILCHPLYAEMTERTLDADQVRDVCRQVFNDMATAGQIEATPIGSRS